MGAEDHPLDLPEGYRLVCRFHWRPIEVAGRHRWREYVRYVQRLEVVAWDNGEPWEWEWVDVGFFDEWFPAKGPTTGEVG